MMEKIDIEDILGDIEGLLDGSYVGNDQQVEKMRELDYKEAQVRALTLIAIQLHEIDITLLELRR